MEGFPALPTSVSGGTSFPIVIKQEWEFCKSFARWGHWHVLLVAAFAKLLLWRRDNLGITVIFARQTLLVVYVMTVTDVDECQRPGMCQHTCRNTWGSFQCLCDEGYLLAADGRSCDGQQCFIIRLHRMRPMILSRDGVEKWLNGSRSPFWVETLGSSRNVELDGSPESLEPTSHITSEHFRCG